MKHDVSSLDSRSMFIEIFGAESAMSAAESSLALADAHVAAASARMGALQAIAIALDAIAVHEIVPTSEPPLLDEVTRARARRILSRGGFVRTT
jgi:hypothetical protein